MLGWVQILVPKRVLNDARNEGSASVVAGYGFQQSLSVFCLSAYLKNRWIAKLDTEMFHDMSPGNHLFWGQKTSVPRGTKTVPEWVLTLLRVAVSSS